MSWDGSKGLIPAHAGKTTPDGGQAGASRAHPRSRGENQVRASRDGRLSGSSPLTRGKPILAVFTDRQERLIPAHAGKTGCVVGDSREHEGSSPLTRGKRGPREQAQHGRGLIPAHAGKTAVLRALKPGRGAHPRSRGENPDGGKYTAGRSGSSPLTRGKRSKEQNQRQRERLIPAHAGKTER